MQFIFSIKEYCALPVPHLLIQVSEGQRSITQKRQLYLSTLKALAVPETRDLINKMVQEEIRFSKLQGSYEDLETKSFNLMHLVIRGGMQLLSDLANAKMLFFQGVQLTLDLHSQCDFYIALAEPNEGKLSGIGRIRIKGKEVDIKDCDFVIPGPPHYIICEKSLYKISGEFEAKWLNLARSPQGIILSAKKAEDLLEEMKEDKSIPLLRLPESSKSISSLAQEIDVFPLLKLTDRSGAFADLWMDYGQGRLIAFHEQCLDKHLQAIRRPSEEKQWEQDLLETGFVKKHVGGSHYYCPLDKVGKSLTFLLECGWTIRDWREKRLVKQGEANLELSSQGPIIMLKGRVHFGDFTSDVSKVMGAFNRKEQFIDLTLDTCGLLSFESLRNELGEEFLDGEFVADGIKYKKNRLGLLSRLWDEQRKESSLIKITLDASMELLKQRVKQFEEERSGEQWVPSERFQGALRPYQQKGVEWISLLHEFGVGGILADDMGLGKTVQVIAFLSRLKLEKGGLIIAPTSLLFHWRLELERFLPSLPVVVYSGRDRSKQLLISEEALVITSYTILRMDLEILMNRHFDVCILDEATAIKNADTQVSQAACSIVADFRLCLTGTPLENRLEEIWGLFHFLAPDLLGSKEQFQKEMQAALVDNRFMQRLKKKIKPLMLRRTKKEVAPELPEKIEQTVWIEMDERQRVFYEQFLRSTRTNLLKKVSIDGMSAHRMEVLETILRLRQICCHPLLIEGKVSLEKAPDCPSSKWQVLIEDLQTVIQEGRKALVYSQFTGLLQLLAKHAKQEGWLFCYLDGSTTNREEVVRSFQEDSDKLLFFISLKAGGVGLNLTSADYVYIFDPWWNDAVENQAIDRAHRIGRKEPVIAKRLIVLESIEEKMMKLKSSKKALTEQLFDVDYESGGTGTLTEEDLEFLLS